jgi:hypothetical protein
MIQETAAELRAIAESCTDARGYFPALYSRVTSQISESMSAGAFADGDRMNAFATGFAVHYTSVWKHVTAPPRCWQASWDVAGDDRLLIVQHLLLGINAHVNYDLPQAAAEAGRRVGDLSSIRGDFDAINDVLSATSVGVLRDLDRVARWTNEVATVGGGRAFNFSLRVARTRAWRAAEQLYALDAAGQRAYLTQLDQLVSVLAYLITRPALPVEILARIARRFEQHNPQRVIAALLGRT